MKQKRQSAKPPSNQLCVFCWKFDSWPAGAMLVSFCLFSSSVIFVLVVARLLTVCKSTHKEMVNDRCKVIH